LLARCAAELLLQGHEVEIVDNLATGHRESVPAGASLHEVDIGHRAALSDILSKKRFDAVFHFAAKASVPESVTNPGPFFDVNVARGIFMLEVLRQHGIRNFVFSSTAAIYGIPTVSPIPERHSHEPVNPYGESKLMFECVLQQYAAAYDWTVVAFRYFNACGGAADWGERHEPATHIIPLLLQAASGRREYFQIFGTDYPTPDGTCLRDYVHVLDIAQAHLLALRRMGQGGFSAYNIGTGISHSVREVCEAATKITARTIDVRTAPRRPGDPPALCANPRRLMADFGWRPRYSSLENILAGAWEWEQRQSAPGRSTLMLTSHFS
jgi:UDP-glucose 4-epimerase